MGSAKVKKIHLVKAKIAGDLIKTNLTKHYRIPDLARITGLSDCMLKKSFKELYGMGLYKFYKTEKLNMAKHLIYTTDKPLKVIYEEVGFKRLTSFITSFKHHFGETPGVLVAAKEAEEKGEYLKVNKRGRKEFMR